MVTRGNLGSKAPGLPATADEGEAAPSRLLDRGLDVLFMLARHPNGARLSEIERECGLSRATVLRILRTMMAREAVMFEEGGKTYGLGLAIVSLGSSAQDADLIRKIAAPFLEELSAATGETAALFKSQNGIRFCIDSSISNHDLGYRIEAGQRRPLAYGSGGQVLIAYQAPDAQAKAFQGLDAEHVALVRRKFSRLYADGTLISRDETMNGVTGVASPIFDRRGMIVASLAVIGPTARMDKPTCREYGLLVKRACGQISGRLGYSGEGFGRTGPEQPTSGTFQEVRRKSRSAV